jgi:hypothetical protein
MVGLGSTAVVQTNKESERILDVIMYILSLTETAFRFSKGDPPFDFMNTNTAEYLTNKNIAFLQDVDTPYEKAHEIFLKEMFQAGWQYGQENFEEKSHPDLVFYEELPMDAKSRYAFSAAIIQSAKGFYSSLRMEIESELMENISPTVIGRTLLTRTN